MISVFTEGLQTVKNGEYGLEGKKKSIGSLMKDNGLIKKWPSYFSQFDKKCYLCL